MVGTARRNLNDDFPLHHNNIIRSESFSAERLYQHAGSLALAHRVLKRSPRKRILEKRLKENNSALRAIYRKVGKAIGESSELPPAAEWLVDNYFIIEEQIRDIRNDLPPKYYLQLPKLSDGYLKGYPRVYGIAWAFIAHTDSYFNPELLEGFVRAYQEKQPLKIGELWAIAISLRIALVENLRRAAAVIIEDRENRSEADELADVLVAFIDNHVETLEQQYRRIDDAKLSSAFSVQLIQRLRDQGAKVLPLLARLDGRLAQQGTSADQIVRTEHQNQGALTVTVRNIITSMRSISTFDWVSFFERVSLVDSRLRADSKFGEMDLPTRNLYRHAVERFAQSSQMSELDVTGCALELANASRVKNETSLLQDQDKERQTDPGYYLIDAGRAELERRIGFKPTLARRFKESYPAASFIAYIVANLILVTCIIELGLSGTPAAKHSTFTLLIISIAVFFPAWEAAITLVNRTVISFFTPTILPGMELLDGVPVELRTMVVVPTLLTSTDEIQRQVEQLEVHYLSNADGDLRFALLTDWTDADEESCDADERQTSAAVAAIKELNDRHPLVEGEPRFFLFHRKRSWNPREHKWMGWERKRGKLHELNLLLRGSGATYYITDASIGFLPPPQNVKYVVTLDSDTRLPRGTVKRLIGKMAHPLNRACLDDKQERVVQGYGILQPRVSSSLPHDASNSFFQKVFYSASGIDPYAFAISDVYQDLFAEGSFTGKGIYDVDIFEKTIAGKLPENTVLSHDLLEGIFARAGLASDVEVVEEFPSRYDVASSRQHRWARGDWQLLPWIFGEHAPRVSALGHWKMVDNLRRTLTAPFSLIALLIGWTFPLTAALLWTALIIVTLSLPLLLGLFEGILPRSDASKSTHILIIAKDCYRTLQQVFLMVTFLPHQAWLMLDAITRTTWRMAVSRRNLLEWVTASEVKVRRHKSISGFYAYMSGSLVLVIAAAISLSLTDRPDWILAIPFLAFWTGAPAVAQLASRSGLGLRRKPLNDDEVQSYRLVARLTWRFFERFVTENDNYLPPDNFQEEPIAVVARRTSPTNIGLYLLTVAAANDFGWVSVSETLSRLAATFDTLSKMERFNGHFYNWYDTSNLNPLLPRYISSVDSGNLAGYFVVTSQVCKNLLNEKIVGKDWIQGLLDVVTLVQDAWRKVVVDEENATARHIGQDLDRLKTFILSALLKEVSLLGTYVALTSAVSFVNSIEDLTATFYAERGRLATVDDIDVRAWGEDLARSVKHLKLNLDHYAPWLGLLSAMDAEQVRALGPVHALLSNNIPTLTEVQSLPERFSLACEPVSSGLAPHQNLLAALLTAVQRASAAASDDIALAASLAQRAQTYFSEMDFSFLLDPARKLLSIGYRIDGNVLDPSFYDLLASEARLASIVAIAKGDIPAQNWFRLGRTVTSIEYRPALVSWSGSMFEYLMPTLVVREPDDSLIGQTNRMVVKRQIAYGAERGVPWGVSESAYNARDFEFTYQYSSFGVPGLGLKRGLSENIVVAPYATALAAMIEPHLALENLQVLESMGGRGLYGWYEAFDFTGKRLPEGKKVAVVHAYMAHHQGMSLVAILNVLYDGIMRNRFHSEPTIQATELLLQELPPRNVAIARPRSEEVAAVEHIREIAPPNPRLYNTPHTTSPRTHLLSNGEYAIMVTAAGSGYSVWRNYAVTRWREDPTRDAWGSYIYIRNAKNGKVWSATYQPICAEPEMYNVAFFEDHAEFARKDGAITTSLNVVISSEDSGEVRRLSIHNNSTDDVHDIELTSYAELVLTHPAGDIAHPAFSKLFVQTEFDHKSGALLATRRLRTPEEKPIWAVHLVSVGGEMLGGLQYETDRARFIGRGRTVRNPQAVDGRPLNDTVGVVLDPIFSLRCRVRVQPGGTAHVAFWTLTAASREEALELADKYGSPSAYNRAAARAWTQAQLQYQHLGMTPEEAHLFQRLANYVLYSDRGLRPNIEKIRAGSGSQSKLWSLGVSGDLPIVVMRVDVASDLKTLRQMVRAYSYWSFKRLEVDLVILNEQPTTYLEDLQNEIELLVRTNQSMPGISSEGVKGRIFVFRGDHVAADARDLLLSVARAVIVGHRGSLAEQLQMQARDEMSASAPVSRVRLSPTYTPQPRQELEFFNGTGGFADNGREYVTVLEPGQVTPAPWINVIANPNFGFHVSAEGSGYTWAVNSREFKLTPWSNDPTTDEPGEIIYLRDAQTGAVWTPTATPIRKDGATYIARHGFGYSQFETSFSDIDTSLLQFVALKDPIKISRLRVKNSGATSRKISVTSYTEWALAPSRLPSAPFLIVDKDAETGAMLVNNPWSNEYAERVGFVHMSGGNLQSTADRKEFIGRNGALRNPLALATGNRLSGRTGAGLDPCSVLQTTVEIGPGEEIEIVVLLGDGSTRSQAKQVLTGALRADLDSVFAEVREYWRTTLCKVQIKTPDRAMDIMQNGWLLYQTIVCRIWARSAFYQSSGAYGYRDQLQDTMAVVLNEPQWTRQHLLRAASRQFFEGDVQHWWLPSDGDAGRGVRTRFSDDPLWLAYVTAYYIKVTGDKSVLDENVSFLEADLLNETEHESFSMPRVSERSATLYDHCVLAINSRLGVGAHGISLFGGGDWNDGMNRVGVGGTGESVWLAWFLLTVIKEFSPLVKASDLQPVENWQVQAAALTSALDQEGWDGEWYRRGFYDDGTPLGSASSSECRIDSIAQSWSVISGASDPAHQSQAMKALEQYLIKSDDGLAMLFAPPFDHTQHDPGYIKGYPPGIRENGGQYTHAALWSVIAFNIMGNGDKGFELFSMLSPINHSSSRASSFRYKTEPYVVAADIYSNPQHLGRGGWTWYTGSSGWMYRTGLESVLGFHIEGNSLRLSPCIPKKWTGFEVTYRHGSTTYVVELFNPRGLNRGILSTVIDGLEIEGEPDVLPLLQDGKTHYVKVTMG